MTTHSGRYITIVGVNPKKGGFFSLPKVQIVIDQQREVVNGGVENVSQVEESALCRRWAVAGQ